MTATSPDKQIAMGNGRGSIKSLLFGLMMVSVVAGGSGFLAGGELRRSFRTLPPNVKGDSQKSTKSAPNPTQVLQLPDIVTNLAGESGRWARLTLSVVIGDDKSMPPELGPQLAQDAAALIRTLTIAQVSGATGFQHLREELSDRLQLRSAGRIKDILLQSMVIE